MTMATYLLSQTTTGNDLGTTPTIKHTYSYIWDYTISTGGQYPTGTYITDRVAFKDTEDGSGNQKACQYTQYDGQSYGTGQQSGLTKGLATQENQYASCTSGGGSGEVTTKTGYNQYGAVIHTLDADANAGISGHQGCGGNAYTTCTSYESAYDTLPSAAWNALNQETSIAYTPTQADGYGLWPSSVSDANGQTTSTGYDYLGRVVSTTLPGETNGDTTTAISYSYSACPATGPSAPCLEVDTTQRLDSSTTVTSRAFYDGWGHQMESRKPGPNGQDVVQFAQYDTLGRQIYLSQPYFVMSGTGYSTPDMSQPGTQTTYDGLGRVIIAIQPNSATTNTSYSATCNAPGLNDTGCYSETTTIDPDSHQKTSFADAQGQDFYDQDWTGTGPYTSYRVIRKQYDSLGNVVNTRYADGSHAATATYDDLSRLTAISDPDLGSWTYSYDANGNKTQSVDPRGSSGTVYMGYDGLNRVLWQSVNSNGSNPFASNTYDGTANGNEGIGHLTSETFASGPSQSIIGSYAYTYDGRGRKSGWSMSINNTNYPFTFAYNDADQQTSTTYPDGDVVTTAYSGQGWFADATEKLGNNPTTTLIAGLAYQSIQGAAGIPSSASVGNGTYTWNLTTNNDLRLTEEQITQGSTVEFDQTRAYDAVGNVYNTNTTLPQGTDHQAFCYDEQNRLIWAGSTGTPPCQGLTEGTLTSAAYQQSYSYDTVAKTVRISALVAL